MTDNIKQNLSFYTKRAAAFDSNIIVNSAPPGDQCPYLVGEEWSFMLIPEDIATANSSLLAEKRKAEQAGLRGFPSRFDSLQEANEFIRQLIASLPATSLQNFINEQIEQPKGIYADTKVYVLVIARPMLNYGTPPPGYKFSLEVHCYLPASM